MWERFNCFNVNFRLLKTIYVHLLVCYLNKLQNARRNDKDLYSVLYTTCRGTIKLDFIDNNLEREMQGKIRVKRT